jgi:hypothetical protein
MSQNLSAQTKKRALAPETPEMLSRPTEAQVAVPLTSVRKIEADGVQVFYRAAGDPSAPVVLLLHGFPTSSFMFRELIPRLADLPGNRAGSARLRIYRGAGRTKIYLLVRRVGRDDRSLHASTQNKTLCTLCVRLWRANRLPTGDGSPRASRSNHFTERKCV